MRPDVPCSASRRYIGDTNVLEGTVQTTTSVSILDKVVPVDQPLTVGSRVRFGLRPERIVLNANDPRLMVERAKVEEVIYLGDTTKYRFRTTQGKTLLCIQSNSPGTQLLDLQKDIVIGWDPADLRILQDGA